MKSSIIVLDANYMRILNIIKDYNVGNVPKTVSFINFASVQSYFDNESFDEVEYFCDGMLASFLFSMVTREKIKRVSFDNTSIAPKVFNDVVLSKKRLCLIGADDNQVQLFVEKIEDQYVGLKVELFYSGYFDETELSCMAQNISKYEIDTIVLSLGAGKQESTLLYLKRMFPRISIFTCGGFIRQEAGSSKEYYPKWVDKFNIRFIYRMYKEPHTIKRYLVSYPINLLKLIYMLSTGKLKVRVI